MDFFILGICCFEVSMNAYYSHTQFFIIGVMSKMSWWWFALPIPLFLELFIIVDTIAISYWSKICNQYNNKFCVVVIKNSYSCHYDDIVCPDDVISQWMDYFATYCISSSSGNSDFSVVKFLHCFSFFLCTYVSRMEKMA